MGVDPHEDRPVPRQHPGSPPSTTNARKDPAMSETRTPLSFAEDEVARPVVVGMVLFPDLTLLDLVSPHTAFSPSMQVCLIASTMDEIVCDTGIRIRPQTTFADAPPHLDVLFVPGGAGTARATLDAELLQFLAERGATAGTSPRCAPGSIVLGAAGLLDGYQATTHWTHLGLLELFGAQPRQDRVVIDRNRITGGGVTAGIDFALTVLEQMQGRHIAEVAQLSREYNPQPPLNSGSPHTADPAVVSMAESFVAPGVEAVRRSWQNTGG